MKDGKLTSEDFPLGSVVMTVDVAKKTGFNGVFAIDYTQRLATMRKANASLYSDNFISENINRLLQVYNFGKTKEVRHMSRLEPIHAIAKYDPANVDMIHDATGVDCDIELKYALVHELVQEITRRTLGMLLTYGEETRRGERGWFEKFISFFSRKYVKRQFIDSHEDMNVLLAAMKNGILRRTGMQPDYIVTNLRVAAMLADMMGYVPAEARASRVVTQVIKYGHIRGLTIFVDQYMNWNDSKILMGASTKNNIDGLYMAFNSETLTFHENKMPSENDVVHINLDAAIEAKLLLLRGSAEMKECCVSYLKINKNVL